MTDSNISTARTDVGALEQLKRLTRQTAQLAALISTGSHADGPDEEYDPGTDWLNNYELATQLLTEACEVAEELSHVQAFSERAGPLQLSIVYAEEYYRMLFRKVGHNDFDRCAAAGLGEYLANDLCNKVASLEAA